MENSVRDYDFPDSELLNEESDYKYLVWRPQRTCIILGNGNKSRESVFAAKVEADKIPVIKRPTGGQTVLLSPKMLIISAVKNEKKLPFKSYYRIYGERIIKALKRLRVIGLGFDGISDITLNGRKILGSAMHYSRKRIFFHAVLNVAEEAQTIQNYLRFPKITPDYREGRSHLEFVTSLHEQGFLLPPEKIQKAIALEMSFPPE